MSGLKINNIGDLCIIFHCDRPNLRMILLKPSFGYRISQLGPK